MATNWTTLTLATLLAGPLYAQSDALAYMPREAPERTADDTRISMSTTDEVGVVSFRIPEGCYRVDLLDAQGDVVDQFGIDDMERFELERLKPGTWTIRAHSSQGIRIRRFVVHGRDGRFWADEVAEPRKRR